MWTDYSNTSYYAAATKRMLQSIIGIEGHNRKQDIKKNEHTDTTKLSGTFYHKIANVIKYA